MKANELTIKRYGFRSFNDSDWDCYAGSENFENGDDPLIAEWDDSMVMDGKEPWMPGQYKAVTIIIEKNGLYVAFYLTHDDIDNGKEKSFGIDNLSKDEALTFLGRLKKLDPMLFTLKIYSIEE